MQRTAARVRACACGPSSTSEDGHVGAGAQDIADRPLLVRQLQFLRDCGVEDVCVEVCEGPHAAARAQFLLSHDPLMAHVQVFQARIHFRQQSSRGARGSRKMSCFSLCLLTSLSTPNPTYKSLRPHATCSGLLRGLMANTWSCTCARAQATRRRLRLDTAGWAMRVATLKDAHTLSCAALERQTAGLMLHAAELRPGVWLARGARVSPDATLTAPVWVGVGDARVFAGAKIGPRAVLGPRLHRGTRRDHQRSPRRRAHHRRRRHAHSRRPCPRARHDELHRRKCTYRSTIP